MFEMKNCFWIILCAVMLNWCCGWAANATEEDEFVVILDTESSLMPVFIPDVYENKAGFSESYAQKLRGILVFDFSHNGMTQVLPLGAPEEDLATKEGFDHLNYRARWKELGLNYVIKFQISGKVLAAKIFDVMAGTVRQVHELPLTGQFNDDRRRAHQLSDAIFKAIFGYDGIATTRILYTVTKGRNTTSGSWVSEVWQCDYDGGNNHQVTHDGYYCVTPAYVPARQGYSSGGFFYVSYRQGQPKIYLSSLRDGSGRRFSKLPGNQLHPVVASQRNKVAFISDVGGNPDLYIQAFNPDVGAIGKPRQIFTSVGAQGSPSFSPDGKKIAFVSNMDGVPRIYVIDIPPPGVKLKDIKPTLITKVNRENTCPSWSPDGKKLAYSAKTSGVVRQIWVYDFETGEEKQITSGNSSKENPSWAPDSLHIVFNTADVFSSELYIINLNQQVPTKITKGSGEKRFPMWEPRG